MGCHRLAPGRRVFPPGFQSRDSETTDLAGRFMNLRTLRGTLEPKLQSLGTRRMLGFVVPGPLCCVLGSVVPWRSTGILGNVVLCPFARCNLRSSQETSEPSSRSRPLEPLQMSSQAPTGANSRQQHPVRILSCGTSRGGHFPWMLFVPLRSR